MITKAFYTERPTPLQYMPLPNTTTADLWLRKNIKEIIDPETNTLTYEADEAYMRTDATLSEIESDFTTWYKKASEWQPLKPTPKQTPEERIAALEAENKSLKEQLNNTMSAVDFLLFGSEEV